MAATDLDLRGTWGDRTFGPTTVQELERGYDMGVGSMRVDLRGVELPPGRTTLPLELGAGEIQVLVPDDLCVPDRRRRSDRRRRRRQRRAGRRRPRRRRPARRSRRARRTVRLDVDLGLGAVRVGDAFTDRHGPGRWHLDDGTGYDPAVACAGTP